MLEAVKLVRGAGLGGKGSWWARGLATKLVRIKELEGVKGERVEVAGWVSALRKMKETVFLSVSDGSSSRLLQVVMPRAALTAKLTFGSSVRVRGPVRVLQERDQVEVVGEEVEVVGECELAAGYPFAPRKSYPADYLRQWLHLRFRSQRFGALLRARAQAVNAMAAALQAQGFLQVHTPILTGNDCEGAGEVFKVRPERDDGLLDGAEFFNRDVFLTVSGQLHLEAAARGLGRVYTLGPTFRAENSKSRLHLSEFYMVEAEAAWVERVEELAQLVEGLVRSAAAHVLDTCAQDLATYRRLSGEEAGLEAGVGELLVDPRPYTIMSYAEACQALEEAGAAGRLTQPHAAGQELAKEHELFLVARNGGRPVFVVDWPAELKPFYVKGSGALDLLTGVVGEVAGGSVREDNPAILRHRLEERRLLPGLQWYLDLRQFGNVPTAGFGLGLERFLQALLGVPNIKDTLPFPRWPHHCHM